MSSAATRMEVLKLKRVLLDCSIRITEEKKGLLSLEESKQLSSDIFTSLMSFNRKHLIKAKGEDQTLVLGEIKKTSKTDAYLCYTLLNIDEGSVEDKFNPSSIYDWEKKFYFLSLLSVNTLELNDPYTRSKIRSINTAYARKSIRNFDEMKDTFGSLGKSEIYLVLLKYGILTKASISQLLSHCKKQLAAYKEQQKEDPAKKNETTKFENLVKNKALIEPEVKILEKSIQVSESEMDKVMNWTSYPEITYILEILIHCFVLYNDEMITDRTQESLDPQFLKSREYIFENREIMQNVRDCFYDVWTDPKMMEITKDRTVSVMINKIYMSILSVESDLTYKSCSIMRVYPSLLEFHAKSQLHPEAEECARNLERLTLQLLQGAFILEPVSDPKKALRTSQLLNTEVHLTDEFLDRISSVFKALNLMMKGEGDQKRPWSSEEVLCFKYSLVIYNVPHLILNMLHAITVALSDSKAWRIIKEGIETLRILVQNNVLASAQIFKDKEWTLFRRLYQFIPRNCIVLLMDVANECCALFAQQPYIVIMIIEILSVHLCKLELKLCTGESPKEPATGNMLANSGVEKTLAEKDKEQKKSDTDPMISGVTGSEFILMFGSYELLYRILINCKKHEVKFKMSLSVQLMCLKLASHVVIPFFAREESNKGMEGYLPILIDEDRPEHCKEVLLETLQIDKHKVVHLQWEAYFSILKTLNETCAICQDQDFMYYFEPYFKKYKECQIREILANFNQFNKGITFSTEIIKFYTINFLMDFSPNKQMCLTEELGKEEIISRVQIRVEEIHDIIESINSLKGERFNSDNTEMNQGFILDGLLPAVYKLLNSIQVESFRRFLVEFEIGRIFSCLTDNRTIIMRMLGKEDQIKHLKGGMFKKTQFKKSYDEIKEESYGRKEDLASLNEDLDEFIRFIEEIYEMFSNRPLRVYRMYSRERLATLKNNPRQVFNTMSLTGSISANKFRDRVLSYSQTNELLITRKGKSYIKKHKSLFQHMPFMVSTHQSLIGPLEDKSSYIKKSLEYYMEKKKKCITDPESNKSSIYSILDDGSDSDNDIYYNSILLWIVSFSNKVRNPGQAGSVVHAAKEEPGVNMVVMFNENEEGKEQTDMEEKKPGDRQTVDIKIKFVQEDVVTFSPDFMKNINTHKHSKDDLMISETTFFQWLVILDNLLVLRSTRIKKIMYDNYCAPPNNSEYLEDLTAEEYAHKYQGESKTQEEARKIRDIMNRILGRDFLQLLLESATLFQMTFKSVLFSPYLENNFRYFYVLCSLIQKFADDNNQEFKLFIGDLTLSGDNIVTKLFRQQVKESLHYNVKYAKSQEEDSIRASDLLLYKFYNGLNLKTNGIDKPVVADFTMDEQTDMIWYNIMAINAVSEYFNGPCVKNQNLPINNIDKLFKVLYKINSNINSAHYHLQMAVVRLLSSLFEGGHKGNLARASQVIQPVDLHNLIIKYIKTVYVSRGEFLANRKNPELPAEPMSDARSPEEIMVFYEAYPDFAKHPSIKIANSLLFIFRALGSLGESNKFHKFFREKVEVLYCVFRNSSCLPISQSELRDVDHRISQGTMTLPERSADHIYYYFIHMISEEIEISLNEDTRISIPFPILPKCRFLTNATKANFLKTCNINDTNSKLIDLSTKQKYFEIEMVQNMNLYQKNRLLWTVTQESVFTWVKGIGWGLALIINFLCVWNYRVDAFTKRYDLENHNPEAIFSLNVVSLILELFFLAIWFTFKYSESYEKAVFIHRNDFIGRKFRRYQAVLTQAVLKDSIAASLILGSVLSFLSFWNPFFYSLQLFKIIYLNDTVKYVMRSIWMHLDQLLFTLILVMFTTLSYSVLIGSYFKKDFDSEKTFGVDLCPDSLSCFGYILDLGLRYGGGVGNIMKAYDIFDPTKLFYPKLILELSFFIFINAVSLNIIFGIIVDTFKELRKDMQNRGTLG